MALQDSLSAASISLTRAQSTLSYIFNEMAGPAGDPSTTDKPYAYGISGSAQDLAERLEQLESQLCGLRDVLITPTPVDSGTSSGNLNNSQNRPYLA